jgi:ABC-2 type transport system permease protein
MSNALLIFKMNVISTFKLNYITKNTTKKERTKTFIMLGLIIYAIVALAFTSALNYQIMSDTLILIDAMILIPVLALISSVLISLVTTIYKANGYLFSPKDYDMLASMPISSKDILLAKMLMLLITNYLFVFISYLPGVIVYGMNVHVTIWFYLANIIIMFFIPFIPMVIGSILSYIITRISLRFKKNQLVLTILVFLLFGLIMVGSFAYTQILDMIVEQSASILDQIKYFYYPAHLLIKTLLEGSIFAFLAFLTLSLIIFAISIIVINKQYQKMNAKLKETFQQSNYKLEELEVQSPLTAIFKKDLKRYFGSTMYFINTAFGMFLLLIITVASIFTGTSVISTMIGMDISNLPVFEIILIMFVVINSLSSTTSPSISLEGKYMWIIKSMPIDPKTIYKSKLLLNLLVIVPIELTSAIVLSIVFGFSWIEVILLITIPMIYAFAMAVGGLLINILKPTFQWEQEVTVVKQSMSVLFTMLYGMALVAAPIVIYTSVQVTNIYIFASLVGGLVLMLTWVMYGWVMTTGVKRYYEFS